MHQNFKNRIDAAIQLTHQLEKYKNQEGVVLAIPRGGVPLGCYIAKKLNLPLDLLMTKKLGHPFNPEYAIGAVSLEGNFVDEMQEVSEEYVEQETQNIRHQLKERYKKFMNEATPADLKNKIAIIVDDGIATGRTMIASIKMIRSHNPKKIIVAVPVAPYDTGMKIKPLVDEYICLYTPEIFYGVGMFYDDFSQVNDEDVIALLRDLNGR